MTLTPEIADLNCYPPVFFQKTVNSISKIMRKLVNNIKRLRKIPDCWKVAAVKSIYKKDDKRLMRNYCPDSLLKIDKKVLENFIYKAHYQRFTKYFCAKQHCFVPTQFLKR